MTMTTQLIAISNHLCQWVVAGSAWKDYGLTMPVGIIAMVEAAEHTLADGIVQDITQIGGAVLIVVTIGIKIFGFIKDNWGKKKEKA